MRGISYVALRRARSRVASAAVVVALVTGAVTALPSPAWADTVRGLQWYLTSLHIAQAQKYSKGKGVIVAVIDTGVDATHPDLSGQVLAGHGIGADTAPDGRRDPDSKGGHGTIMAGVIAGRGGDEMHELGIAPQAKILPVALGTSIDSDETSAGIRWAVDHGARVINVSLGGTLSITDAETRAVRYALDHDAVVVAGVGNLVEGFVDVSPLAKLPGVIAVSGTARSGNFWSGSVQGAAVVLAAPAEQIIGPAPKSASANRYLVGDGTSAATAIVSGVAALVRARYPKLDAANVINRLIRTAQDRGAKGRDLQYGFGLVDPVAALTASVPAVRGNPLLGSATSGPATGGSTEDSGDVGGPPVSISITNKLGVAILCGVIVAVIVGVLILVLVQRGRRRRATPVGPPPGRPPPVQHRPYGEGDLDGR